MTVRDLMAIALRTLAVWLFASGVAGLCSSLFTWAPDVVQYGAEATTWRLAAASIFVPIGALIWLSSAPAAKLAFPLATELVPTGLNRADLYAFASALVGLGLLSDTVPQITYWIVIWRSARGTGFWEAASSGTTQNSVVYWVHVRAQVGLVLTKTVLGLALLFGPDRLKAGVMRIRREFSSPLLETEPQESGDADAPRDGA